MTHWIDAIDDEDIELLGMSDDELDAYAYEAAEPLDPVLPLTFRRREATETSPDTWPHAA